MIIEREFPHKIELQLFDPAPMTGRITQHSISRHWLEHIDNSSVGMLFNLTHSEFACTIEVLLVEMDRKFYAHLRDLSEPPAPAETS